MPSEPEQLQAAIASREGQRAFGADDVRGDDAERAVRCGLALSELGRELAVEVHAAHGHTGFSVRVGIHTGGVMPGGGVGSAWTIRGIAVNIAARMQQIAPAGTLRTWSHAAFISCVSARRIAAAACQAPRRQ